MGGCNQAKARSASDRPRRNDELPQGSGGSDEAIALANQHHRRRHRQRCHDEPVHVVGSRGRPWLDLSPSNWSGPICWSSRTWHKDEAGLWPTLPEQPRATTVHVASFPRTSAEHASFTSVLKRGNPGLVFPLSRIHIGRQCPTVIRPMAYSPVTSGRQHSGGTRVSF